ncbi:hypothetical protein [Paenibacillus naphthalenovorans]|uniref:hypothetical protein n=1 Tax=Paenibacillus naphthalenovorans TaxID=162209 RepID=UPI003D29336B
MLVKINSYELLKKAYGEFKANKAARDAEAMEAKSKMREVNEEVAAAQDALDKLVDKSIATEEDLAAEIAQAKSRVTVAEAKKSRIEAKQRQAAEPHTVKPSTKYVTVFSEIHTQIGTGQIFEAFQPELDEINELREQYRKKVQAVLVKMHQVNKELSAISREAVQMERDMTGEDVNYIQVSPLTESHLQPWLWVGNDLQNEMAVLRKAALQTAEPNSVAPAAKNIPTAQGAAAAREMSMEDYIRFNQNLAR